ncbi:hypothetical protein ACFQZZ_11445 [Nocardia sp. GCM10030253]|uniref:hypothetical protein n=1 Tax=Nocardia sp. GCM10030253 TaxID=3273404 RepID=UPI003644C627
MSYPGGYPPQGQQPGQWPGQPAPQYGAPQPYGAPQYAPDQQAGQPQPAYGQPPVSQPQIPQPAYGQPVSQPHIPQPAYAQPAYGQPQAPQFGQQPAYGQPYGQPAPQFAQQAPYGAPPAPPGITVDASYSVWTFLLALTKPKILVNGQRVPNTRWGQNHIPVGPGQYHVKVTTPWLFDMGPATVTAPIAEGQGTRFYYRAPVVIFLNGAIGQVPQKTPGMVFLYITWALTALIILLNIVTIASM